MPNSSEQVTGRPWWAWVLLVLGGFAAAAGVVALVWLVPPLLYSYVPEAKDRAAAEATTRTGMLAGLAGLAAFATFWLNRRVYQVTARTFEVTEQGHITDRYTKAIGQLGDDKLDIRLGGIYALERLAVDSQRDHPTVVEVLSAFIRERSKPPEEPAIAEAKPSLATDVQAALTVLGRLPVGEGVSRGDLSVAHLTGARLAGANLTRANLYEANLAGARLSGADLTGANLSGADLTGANLGGAALTDADLGGAALTDAHLGGADLTGTDLIVANLTDADLGGAILHGARLRGAILTRANLSGAILTLANLSEADLTGANLDEADLTGARNLTDDQVASPRGTAKTRLPGNITRPESWDSPTA